MRAAGIAACSAEWGVQMAGMNFQTYSSLEGELVPLYEIEEEAYTVYLDLEKGRGGEVFGEMGDASGEYKKE